MRLGCNIRSTQPDVQEAEDMISAYWMMAFELAIVSISEGAHLSSFGIPQDLAVYITSAIASVTEQCVVV